MPSLDSRTLSERMSQPAAPIADAIVPSEPGRSGREILSWKSAMAALYMDGAVPRVTLKLLLPPLLGRSTTTVTLVPGAYERIFTIAAT